MGEISTKGRYAWRGYDNPQLPAEGTEHKPAKEDIFAFVDAVDALVAAFGDNGAYVLKDNRAALDGDLAHAADTYALVLFDAAPANNGYYKKSGASGTGSWTRLGPDPRAVAGPEMVALAYSVDRAYATLADYTADAPDPEVLKVVAVYADPNPGNNVMLVSNGTAFEEGAPTAANAPWIKYRESGNRAFSLAFETWNDHWNSGFAEDGNYAGLRLNIQADGVVNFNPGSRYIDVRVDETPVFAVDYRGGVRSGSDTVFAGFKHMGAGTLALTSLQHPGSGLDSPLVVMNWADPDHQGPDDPESTVEVNWQGGQRLHMKSASAFVLDSGTSHFELEGLGQPRIVITGYESASANGKTIDFTNDGHAGTHVTPLSASSEDNAVAAFAVASIDGEAWTERVRLFGTGAMWLAECSEEPAAPASGLALFVQGGVLKSKNPSGVVAAV